MAPRKDTSAPEAMTKRRAWDQGRRLNKMLDARNKAIVNADEKLAWIFAGADMATLGAELQDQLVSYLVEFSEGRKDFLAKYPELKKALVERLTG